MKSNVYDPLPSINQSTMPKEEKESFSKPEKAEKSRFNQNLPLQSEKAIKTLKSLSKLFGGLIPTHDAFHALRKEGFNNPEALIKKLLSEGRIYEPKIGFLSFLGD